MSSDVSTQIDRLGDELGTVGGVPTLSFSLTRMSFLFAFRTARVFIYWPGLPHPALDHVGGARIASRFSHECGV